MLLIIYKMLIIILYINIINNGCTEVKIGI